MSPPSKTGLSGRPLAFAHIGDLHITDAKQRNFSDFMSIVAQIEIECGGMLDFVVLPGDNADNGAPAQYRLIATALITLSCPVHLIAGDHDMEQGSLDAFYAGLGADRLPKAVTVRGVRCLFVDIVGSGGGGPDFCLGVDQMQWLERELKGAEERGETAALFMHSYPADLKGDGEAEALNGLIGAHNIALVDMGHTHYNELANDGRTVFAANPFDRADRRGTGRLFDRHDRRRRRGLALQGARRSLSLCRGHLPGRPQAHARSRPGANRRIRTPCAGVRRAASEDGEHTLSAPARTYVPVARAREGSDAASVGAWPENGISGTQLGPNRNAKPVY
jgi:Icc protein